jgi:hypothetical protein
MMGAMQPNMYSNTLNMVGPAQQASGMMGGGYGNSPMNQGLTMFKKHRLV